MRLFKPSVRKMLQDRDVLGLIAALQDKNDDRRDSAVQALGEIGDVRTVEPLIERLKDKNKNVRIHAADALGQLEDTRAVDPLIAALQDQEWYVNVAAGRALGNIGDIRAVEPLIAALKDEHWFAVSALSQIGGSRALEALGKALKAKDDSTRIEAAFVLAQHDDKRVVPVLVEAVSETWVERHKCKKALVNLGAVAVQPLISILHDENHRERGFAASVLGDICSQLDDVLLRNQAVDALIDALQDQNARVGAVAALKKIGDERAVPAILAIADDPNPYFRREIADVLHQLGWKPAQVMKRGGFGEPYCSEECYKRAAEYPLLQIEAGAVCGICGSPISASEYGSRNYGVVPYEGGVLVVCQNCTGRAREHFRTYDKCCMCQKSIAI